MTRLVRNARAYLLSFDGVTAGDVDAHLEGWRHLQKDSIEGLYRSFLNHAKNRQGMPNTIGDIARLDGLFFDFDPGRVVAAYATYADILDRLVAQKVPVAGRVDPDNSRSHWVVFAKSALSSAAFLSRFQDAREFHHFVHSFDANEYTRLALPLLLKEEVFGFGFALACDFLKENGYSGLVKPDVHLNAICRAAGISGSQTDYGVFKDVIAYCEEHDLVPYEFDKLIWLVGSGELYPGKPRLRTSRNVFIDDWLGRGGVPDALSA